ncbi:MAG: formylglycine-generating enzyme family protein [Fibromonadales bacterium]|nr:formylglycine-generating enzyme family protein [Fibromonadales bacterium]MCL2208029.1 formylglycine-generating enzyme family protein [Fibromonadales bacterium]
MQKRTVFILVAALSSVLCFAQDSTASDSPTGVLSIHSFTPAGVWINGQAVGNTPFSMDVPAGWAVYSIRATGYWTETFIAKIVHGEKISQELQLKKYGLPPSEMPDISHINDLRTLELLYDSLSKEAPTIVSDSICLAVFAADYPLPISPPSPLNMDSEEYRHYYQIYMDERQVSFNEWYASCTSPGQKLNMVVDRINMLGTMQLNGFVPVASAKFEKTDEHGLKGNLELHFLSPDGRADVVWRGAWENDFLTGETLAKALTAEAVSALAFLTTKNQTLWLPIEGGYSRHFYKYYDLSISWNGLLFPMKGQFILPERLANLAPKDSLPQPPVAEEPAPGKAFLAKIPAGRLKYKGKEMQIRSFNINTAVIDQGLYKAKCGKKDFKKIKGDSLPAHSVTWKEANSCCIALGGELPTEAEWEYAARAGSPLKQVWPNNANPKDYAIFEGKKPVASGSKKPNGWGLYDMFGNVAEWVKDDGFWFGKYKYLKGGSWKSKAKDLSFENKEEEDARYWGTHTGFRCVFRP